MNHLTKDATWFEHLSDVEPVLGPGLELEVAGTVATAAPQDHVHSMA